MDDRSKRYFLIGQSSLLLNISICILILPQGLFANDGISYYSAHKATLIPYMIGLLSVAWFSYKLSESLPRHSHPVVKVGFKAISALILLVVAVPYGVNYTLEYIHTLTSAALFLMQFLMMWWLAFRVRCDVINLMLLLLMAIEMIATVMYLSPRAGYLLEGELAFQLTFALAAYRTISYILSKSNARGEARS